MSPIFARRDAFRASLARVRSGTPDRALLASRVEQIIARRARMGAPVRTDELPTLYTQASLRTDGEPERGEVERSVQDLFDAGRIRAGTRSGECCWLVPAKAPLPWPMTDCEPFGSPWFEL